MDGQDVWVLGGVAGAEGWLFGWWGPVVPGTPFVLASLARVPARFTKGTGNPSPPTFGWTFRPVSGRLSPG